MYDRSELLKAGQALTDKIMTGVKAPRRWLSRTWLLLCVFGLFAALALIFAPMSAVALGWAGLTNVLSLLGEAAGCAGFAYGIWYCTLSGKPLPAWFKVAPTYVWGVSVALVLALMSGPTQRARIAEGRQETQMRRTLYEAYVSTSPGTTRADFDVCQELPR